MFSSNIFNVGFFLNSISSISSPSFFVNNDVDSQVYAALSTFTHFITFTKSREHPKKRYPLSHATALKTSS